MYRALAHILRRSLRTASACLKPYKSGLWLLFFVACASVLISYTRADWHARVYAATSTTLNFQARLMSATGKLVPDGSYSIQFKLYDAVSGGTNEWTETQNSVTVRNGYLSVRLGSATSFGSGIDWSQEKWLTMNVNGDGEMSPRVKLTAVPYSFRSAQADSLTNGSTTLTSNNLAQLAPSSPQAVTAALAALRVNQTGAGGLLQFQADGVNVLTFAKNGDITSAGTGLFQGPTLAIGTAVLSGGLVLNDGSDNTGTLKTAALGQNTIYTLPDPGAGSVEICLKSGNCGGAGNLNQGGNAFGTAVTIGSNDGFGLNFKTDNTIRVNIDTNGNLNLINGNFQTAGTTRITNVGALQNITGNNANGVSFDANTITSGLLSVARGGTGVNGSIASNGQLLIGNGTGYSLATLTNNGGIAISNGAGGIGLSVSYGSGANTAVQGNTTIVCPIGAGNLTGGGNTITLGSGGSCNNINTNSAVSFTTSVTTPLVTTAGALTLRTAATAGADDVVFETAGTEKLRLLEDGSLRFEKGAFDLILNVATITGSDKTVTLPNATGTVCLDSGNCLGGSAGGANTALSNLVATSINQALVSNANNSFDLGSSGLTWRTGYFGTSVQTPLLTSTGALSLTSGGGGNISLDSASNILLIAANDTTFRRIAAGNYNIELNDSASTTLVINNTGAGSANLNLADGFLSTAGTTRLTNAGALQNVTGNNTNGVSFDANTITNGLLPVARGGTGAGSFTANGVIFGNNTNALSVTAAGTGGQVLLASATGVPTFTSLSGDITLSASGLSTINADAVALGTDTTGNYVATITVGNGLTLSGAGVETATANIQLDVVTTGNTSTTSSNSGLELTASGLRLISGCGNGQIIKWDGGGSVWNCANDNQGLSDSTIKKNVTGLGSVLNQIKNLNVVEYSFKCNDPLWASYRFSCQEQTGIIAQQLALTFPDLVSLRPDGLNQVDFGRLNFYTLKAVTELAGFIDASGNAGLKNISSGGTQRLSSSGQLQNINGLSVVSNGASITGNTTLSGGTVNINTGTSTGNIRIGGGLSSLVINSTNFDVSSSGALSGITTISASGNVSTSGNYQKSGFNGITLLCSGGQGIDGVNIRGGIVTASACRGFGLSDQRLKENIASLDSSIIEKIKNVNTVNFDFKCGNEAFRVMNEKCISERQTGVIAQELAEVFPELVYQDEFGYFRVKYDALNIYTLKATSQIAQKIEVIQSKNISPSTIGTNGTVRIDQEGRLKNINGLSLMSGGAFLNGGINNNGGGITNAGSVDGVSSLSAEKISLRSAGSDSLIITNEFGHASFVLGTDGAVKVINNKDNAILAQNYSGDDIFSVSTAGGLVRIGSSQVDTVAVLLVLDSIDMEGDPPGVNGAQYYNSRMQRFRCYESGSWTNCITYANAEYVIVPQPTSWQQPVEEQEFPGSPRAWVDLSRARDFRITMQINAFGSKYASCYLQYSLSDKGPWNNLAQPGGYMNIGSAGTLKSVWSAIAPEARTEVIVRIVCKDGEPKANNHQNAPKTEFNNIRMQVR